MIKFVPEADSFSGRLLAVLGRVLGLRSETVYSRAILLLTLLLFVVGGLVIAGFWIFLFRQFDTAEQQELRGTALQVRQYLEAGVRPGDVRQIGALVGRQLTVKPVSTERAAALQSQFQGLMLDRSASGVPSASFLLPDPDGPGRLEATLEGTHPLGETAAVAARVFLVALSVTVGVMLLLLLLIVDRTILRRIQLLADKLEHEKKSERLPVQLNYPGDDELAQLARSIEELAILVQAGEREYRHVVEDQTESICRFDAAWRLTFFNRAFEALAVPPPGARRTPLGQCIDAQTVALLKSTVAGLSPASPTTLFTHAVANLEGDETWFRSTLRASFDDQGVFTGGQWIASDVTSEVTAQRKLEESQQQLELLSARLMNLQDQERRKIARELHDSTAQNLSAMEMNLSVLESLGDSEQARKLAADTRNISRQVVREVRNLSYLLHPPLLEEEGLVFAIKWFADGFTKRNGIPVFLHLPEAFPRLDFEIETALFRIVQEALSNIYKHASATKAWVQLRMAAPGRVLLEIRDNGEGLPPGFSLARSAGVGLAGMRERMRQLGGTLEVGSSPYGVSVNCSIGVQQSHAATS